MILRVFIAIGSLVVASGAAEAQSPAYNFEEVVYVTCREAHAMKPEPRKTLAIFLAERSARKRGVVIPDDDRGTQLAYLVRGGCTLSPDAYLFAVIDRAIQAEMSRLPRR